MRTKSLAINGKEFEAVLVAGGNGFKIYSSAEVSGWVLALGKRNVVIDESSPEFKSVSKYVNLKYQPLNDRDQIKQEFEELIAKSR